MTLAEAIAAIKTEHGDSSQRRDFYREALSGHGNLGSESSYPAFARREMHDAEGYARGLAAALYWLQQVDETV